MKKFYNHYLDKRKEIMNSTKFKVEDKFSDFINKNSISAEQIMNQIVFQPKWCEYKHEN